jgi:hypothetical protein
MTDDAPGQKRRRPTLTIELDGAAAPAPARPVGEGSKREKAAREGPEPQAAPAGEKERGGGQETGRKEPDRSFPPEIVSRYYIRADRGGDQRVFADSQGQWEIFQESETRLRTKLNDAHAVKLMIETAAWRGWAGVTVSGLSEFRREAWLEGQARGMAVNGYKPKELDWQELKRREQAYLQNEMRPGREGAAAAPDGRAPDNRPADLAARRAGSPEASAPPEQTRADRRSPDYKRGVEGLLVETGSRPYKDDPKNDPSPYAALQAADGQRRTIWGAGLPEALDKAGAREGDRIRLRELGMERVVKIVAREVNGKTVRMEQEVDRRAWEAEVIRERKTGGARADGAAPDAREARNDRLERDRAAESEAARTVASGERALHSGPGRDAALRDGVYANEARAKEYLAAGRGGAAHNPELRAAAALEAYVERKVRGEYPGEPAVVRHAMNAARVKIAEGLARGYDFPQPRVNEERQAGHGQESQKEKQRPREHARER